MDRRELLKFFGIGATITPVLNGSPLMNAAATLMAEPNIKLLADSLNGHLPAHFQDRMKWNPYEAIWLRFWQIENNPGTWLNGGIGPLEHILKREATDAEKAAVAGMMQWFGTNCGHSFIEETLRACGYRVTWDESLPNATEIKSVQYGSVWPGSPASTVTIARRNQSIKLHSGALPAQ